MEYIALALERDQSHLLENTRLKISEWLDFENRKSDIIITVYLDFSESRKPQELDHIYMIISRNDFEHIVLPTSDEIKKENEKLKEKKLAKKIDAKSRFISPIFIEGISVFEDPKESREHRERIMIRIDLGEFDIDESKKHRFQFLFHLYDSFRKPSRFLPFFNRSWDWIFEMSLHPYTLYSDEFASYDLVKTDLELWVMIEPSMYKYISDLNIRYTQPFDRMVILPEKTTEEYTRDFVHTEELCIRWFFPGFSESGLGAEIIISKKKSRMEREKRYVDKINSDPNDFFIIFNEILSSSKISVDFKFVSNQLEKQEFRELLDILFELTYKRDDNSVSKLVKFLDILGRLQQLKYGRYYFQMYRLLNQMRNCYEVRDIIMPTIKEWLGEFLDEDEFISRTTMSLFKKLGNLIDLTKQYYYYDSPEDKYKQKKEILVEIAELVDIAEHRLINPESYLIAEEVLNRWEKIIEEDFKKFAGNPRLNVNIKTKRLLKSDRINLIFDITNISNIPLTSLIARLLPSEQYDVLEQEKRETTKRKSLTKSDEQNERIFSPEFVILPKNFPHISLKLEIEAFIEEKKIFRKIFEEKIELFYKEDEFKEIESPYIVGGIVKTKEMFFGRKDVFRKIRWTIRGKTINQAVIYGQYRIGKTSVLYQLMNDLQGEYVPVLASMHALERRDSGLLSFWSEQISSAVKDRVKNMPGVPNYGKSPDPFNEFNRFLKEIMKRLKGAKIVLMIDEYVMIDELIQNDEIGKEFFHLLDWMIKHDKIELIMAGRSPIKNLKVEEWKRIARPFVQIKLGPLKRENADELIRGKHMKDHLEYDDSAIEKIMKLTNCHPYLLQLCCHVLVSYHNLNGKAVLNYADVENCIPEIIGLGSPGFEAIILTDSTPEEQIVLRVMAAELKKQTSISEQKLVVRIKEYNDEIQDKDIKKAVLDLEEKEIIRSVTEEMKRFKFVCELFRDWIVHRWSL